MFDREKHPRWVSEASDGEIKYRFAKLVSAQRAATAFLRAKEAGLPDGSVINPD